MPYRIAAIMPKKSISFYDKIKNLINNIKESIIAILSWRDGLGGALLIILSIIGLVVGLWGAVIHSEAKMRAKQSSTIHHWADQHSMIVNSCMCSDSYCECSVSNRQSAYVVRVTDNQTDRVFSVIRSENLER